MTNLLELEGLILSDTELKITEVIMDIRTLYPEHAKKLESCMHNLERLRECILESLKSDL